MGDINRASSTMLFVPVSPLTNKTLGGYPAFWVEL